MPDSRTKETKELKSYIFIFISNILYITIRLQFEALYLKHYTIRPCACCYGHRPLQHIFSVKLYINLLQKQIGSYYGQRYNLIIITYSPSQFSTFFTWHTVEHSYIRSTVHNTFFITLFLWCRSVLVASLPLDLADLDNIATCSDKLKSFLGPKKINVLMNNAGIMALPSREVKCTCLIYYAMLIT